MWEGSPLGGAAEQSQLLSLMERQLHGHAQIAGLLCRQHPGRWIDCCLQSHSLICRGDAMSCRVYRLTMTQMTRTIAEATSADAL